MKNRLFSGWLAAVAVLAAAGIASAHDTWVETNTNLVRVGDTLHVDLMLGNHGNDHRDFTITGKIDPHHATLDVIGPAGQRTDLKPGLIDAGHTPKEGYWTVRFQPAEPGLYLVAHTYDHVVHYAPKRSVKSAKAFFVASESLDQVPANHPGYDRVLGHPLELVPQTNPVTPMGPGTPLRVKLLFKGEPLADTRVSFIPRGVALAEGTDPVYDRQTDADGLASFTPQEGNVYLIVAHHEDPDAAGEGYETTSYTATMTLYVPTICVGCGE